MKILEPVTKSSLNFMFVSFVLTEKQPVKECPARAGPSRAGPDRFVTDIDYMVEKKQFLFYTPYRK